MDTECCNGEGSVLAFPSSLAPVCFGSDAWSLVEDVTASFVELAPGPALPLRAIPSADFSSLARRRSSAYEGFDFPVAFDQAEADMLEGIDQGVNRGQAGYL